MTTQMFFNNDILYHFLYQTLSKGINIPVIAGIMPITNASQIGRVINMSGTYLPPRFKSMVERFEHNPEAMLQAGIAYATEQIIDLICNGVNRIHIYTMNKPEIAAAIMGNLSSIIEA
jgi:methylenetetrahydrofolate reductase (NADPH)